MAAVAFNRLDTIPMNRGLACLARLFPHAVRMRAEPYVGTGVVRIRESEDDLLFANIVGTERYAAMYQRIGDALLFSCTCPFFMDGQSACKHLWALALEAGQRPLIAGAASCSRFEATQGVRLRLATAKPLGPVLVPLEGE
jgi:uncharacterized Zn finger protein